MNVSFLFTNPRHHLEMMVPVAHELERRGHACRMVSLAEIRGLQTPTDLAVPVVRVLPWNLRRRPEVGAGLGHPSGRQFWIRRLLRAGVAGVLVPRVRALVGDSSVLVVPHDTAFPYDVILDRTSLPSVVMQEGIRFEFPTHDSYGTGRAVKLCAWGEGSAELFRSRGISHDKLEVTGAPRLDRLDPEAWRDEGQRLRAALGLTGPTLLFLTNPIETQGFGTKADKLALFERWLAASIAELRRRGYTLLVRNHPAESAAEYLAIIARLGLERDARVVTSGTLHGTLAAGSAALVMTSTVGIDALMFGLPLGVLDIPNHGCAFEYVQRGAASAFSLEASEASLADLLENAADRTVAAKDFVERHLHGRGGATSRVAKVIEDVGSKSDRVRDRR